MVRNICLWMDKQPQGSMMTTTFESGVFDAKGRIVRDPTGKVVMRTFSLESGFCQMPINLKQNYPLHHPHPKQSGGSDHYRIYLRFRGHFGDYPQWANRMPMHGTSATRWGFPDLHINAGDYATLWELPWNGLFPAVPVVEPDQSWHPVFLLHDAPNDYKRQVDEWERTANPVSLPQTTERPIELVAT